MNISSIYRYAQPSTKTIFATKAKAFLNRACKLAGVEPDLINEKASPVKRYPYYNPGGPAVVGDVYLYITKDDTTLEVILGESGLYYRTKKGNQYGNNNYPCGFKSTEQADRYDEANLAEVIKRFMAYKDSSLLVFR